MLADDLKALFTIACRGNDAYLRVLFEHRAQSLPHEGRIVDNNNADHVILLEKTTTGGIPVPIGHALDAGSVNDLPTLEYHKEKTPSLTTPDKKTCHCRKRVVFTLSATGCGSVWLERSVRDAEAGGSNPLIPTRTQEVYEIS